MIPNKDTQVLIVGLGLIGGSYAEALTKQGLTVFAVDTDADSIAFALEKGIIARGTTVPDAALIGAADLVVFALYPRVFLDWIGRYQHLLKPHALLTDVTGVKSCIVYDVQALLRPDVEFIAAHPMAGREVCGVENSDAHIFAGANYIVVPTGKNTPAAIAACRRLGELLGFSRISELSPEQHDAMIGFLSQLTHCIAICLMTCSDNRHLVDYTGDSFRDLTRIARINDAMWSELFLLNRDVLLREIDGFAAELQDLRDLLAAGDCEGLRAKMRLSTERRAWFGDKKTAKGKESTP